MPSNPQLDVPVTLTGLFPTEDDDDEEDDGEANGDVSQNAKNANTYETQTLVLVEQSFQVQQFDFHSHNANCVWPGTFQLAEYLFSTEPPPTDESTPPDSDNNKGWGHVLELGTATGLLAMRLIRGSKLYQERRSRIIETKDDGGKRCCRSVTTSDVDDPQVTENLRHNFHLNNLLTDDDDALLFRHIPHTWGTGWAPSVEKACADGLVVVADPRRRPCLEFDTVVASDILLYVSAYPALVQTLVELFQIGDAASEKKKKTAKPRLILSWNRRMKESAEFFSLMEAAGFSWTHEGNCIYVFTVAGTTATVEESAEG